MLPRLGRWRADLPVGAAELLQGESSVGCLADLVSTSPTVVSQHLSKLRLAGPAAGCREGTYVYYPAGPHAWLTR